MHSVQNWDTRHGPFGDTAMARIVLLELERSVEAAGLCLSRSRILPDAFNAPLTATGRIPVVRGRAGATGFVRKQKVSPWTADRREPAAVS